MVRKATSQDSRILAEMAVQMWGSHRVDDLDAEFAEANRIICFRKTL